MGSCSGSIQSLVSVFLLSLNYWLCSLLDSVARDELILRATLVRLVILIVQRVPGHPIRSSFLQLSLHLFFTISVEGSSVFFSISLCTLVLKGELCTSRAAVVLLIVIAVRVLVVVHDLGELVELAFLANGLVTFGIVVVVTILLRLVDTVHHVLLGVGGQGELDLLFGHSVRVHTLPKRWAKMTNIRRFHNKEVVVDQC